MLGVLALHKGLDALARDQGRLLYPDDLHYGSQGAGSRHGQRVHIGACFGDVVAQQVQPVLVSNQVVVELKPL